MTVEHTTRLQARWGDVDAAGIVFYPRFFEWYDLATEGLFEALGLPWPELFRTEGIVGVPIVESGSRFVSPVRFGDTVDIRARVAWVKDKTFRMEHELAIDGRLCATGFEVRAWVKQPATPGGRLEAQPIPDAIVRRLRGDRA